MSHESENESSAGVNFEGMNNLEMPWEGSGSAFLVVVFVIIIRPNAFVGTDIKWCFPLLLGYRGFEIPDFFWHKTIDAFLKLRFWTLLGLCRLREDTSKIYAPQVTHLLTLLLMHQNLCIPIQLTCAYTNN